MKRTIYLLVAIAALSLMFSLAAQADVAASSSVPTSPDYTDMDLMARIVTAESQGEPIEGQVAVASVLLHRLASPDYPKSIRDIVYERTYGFPQFSVIDTPYFDQSPVPSAIKAVQYALAGWDPSNGATGFYNPAAVSPTNWVARQTKTVVIGGHQFYKAGAPIY